MCNVLVDLQENKSSWSVTLPKPNLRYLNEFVRLNCAPELLAAKVFPDAKEITESMAALAAIRSLAHNYEVDLYDPCVMLLDVGCGSTPRTAALFAFLTKWACHAIDPKLHDRWKQNIYGIDRLLCWQQTWQNFELLGDLSCLVVVAVHAHVDLQHIMQVLSRSYQGLVLVAAIPCCSYDLDLVSSDQITVCYRNVVEDWSCHTPKRTVKQYALELG